jgi:A/G-specific adenine glycosylase
LLRLAQRIGEGGGAVPASRSQLEHLKGVGQYTASAVLAAVHGQAVPLVDVNTARVLGRFFGLRTLADISRDPHLHSLALVAVDCEQSLAVSWAILDLGALMCRARRPLCPACPLRGQCAAFAGQEATDGEKRDFPFGSRVREQNQEAVPSAVPVFREEQQ